MTLNFDFLWSYNVTLFGDRKLGEPKNLISNNIDWWDVSPQQCSVCLKDKIPTFSETQLLSVRVRHLGGRKKWICTMQYAYYAIRMLIVMMMMMNKRLIVVTWQSSRSPWPETIPPAPIPIVQTPYSQRIHFTSSWSSFNLQSYHRRTLFVAKNGLSNWLISRRCSGRTLAFLKLTKYAASLEQKCIIAVDLFVFITRVSNSGIGLMTS